MQIWQQENCKRAVIFMMVILCSACSGSTQTTKSTDPVGAGGSEWYQKTAEDVPLETVYQNLIFSKFESTEQIKTDYPNSLPECRESALNWLEGKNIFQIVEKQRDGAAYEGATLMVNVKIINMRIVSSAARMWGGAWAGSSGMELTLQLVDHSSGQVIREKQLSSWNSAFAAAWSGGGSDRSIPKDMGIILAEYILAIMPK